MAGAGSVEWLLQMLLQCDIHLWGVCPTSQPFLWEILSDLHTWTLWLLKMCDPLLGCFDYKQPCRPVRLCHLKFSSVRDSHWSIGGQLFPPKRSWIFPYCLNWLLLHPVSCHCSPSWLSTIVCVQNILTLLPIHLPSKENSQEAMIFSFSHWLVLAPVGVVKLAVMATWVSQAAHGPSSRSSASSSA